MSRAWLYFSDSGGSIGAARWLYFTDRDVLLEPADDTERSSFANDIIATIKKRGTLDNGGITEVRGEENVTQ